MTVPMFEVQPQAPARPTRQEAERERERRRELRHRARERRREDAPPPPAVHPLSRLGVVLELHPDAGSLGGDYHMGLRCGGCRFRQVAPEEVSGRAFPKCGFGGDWRRATQGATSDVLSYWPACVDYESVSGPSTPGGEL